MEPGGLGVVEALWVVSGKQVLPARLAMVVVADRAGALVPAARAGLVADSTVGAAVAGWVMAPPVLEATQVSVVWEHLVLPAVREIQLAITTVVSAVVVVVDLAAAAAAAAIPAAAAATGVSLLAAAAADRSWMFRSPTVLPLPVRRQAMGP